MDGSRGDEDTMRDLTNWQRMNQPPHAHDSRSTGNGTSHSHHQSNLEDDNDEEDWEDSKHPSHSILTGSAPALPPRAKPDTHPSPTASHGGSPSHDLLTEVVLVSSHFLVPVLLAHTNVLDKIATATATVVKLIPTQVLFTPSRFFSLSLSYLSPSHTYYFLSLPSPQVQFTPSRFSSLPLARTFYSPCLLTHPPPPPPFFSHLSLHHSPSNIPPPTPPHPPTRRSPSTRAS
jgi:hypothetical protein